MQKLIYLNDDFDATVDRILQDDELQGCGLGKRKIIKTLKSFRGDEIATSVFLKKYALRDADNQIIEFTLDEAKDRWAGAVSGVENSQDMSFNYFRELYEYMFPAGRQMFALGNDYVRATYSNCYVTKIQEDSIEGIFNAAQKMARTFSYGGGVGLCIGKLRPADSKVSNSARFSTGAVSFMELYSMTTNLIGQCVAKGERVLTKYGLVAIENLKVGDEVWTKKGYKKIINFFNSGVKKVFKIKDDFGFEILLSEDHIITSEENGNLKDIEVKLLNVGDTVVLIPGTPRDFPYLKLDIDKYKDFSNKSDRLSEKICVPEELDEKLAYILGYVYSCGKVEYDKFNESYTISLSCNDEWPEVKSQLFDYIEEKFNYEPKVKRGEESSIFYIYDKIILNFLNNNNILKQKENELVFPEKILKSCSSVQMAFIAGLFDAGKREYAISANSYEFLQQVKMVLMSNGIVSKNNYENKKHSYGISITDAYAQSMAREMLGMSVKIRNANYISKMDHYITPFTSRSIGIKCNYIQPDVYMSCNCFNKAKKNYNLSELLVKSNILSIDEAGEVQTYDIQLEDENRFYCEGFYIHNCGRRGACMITIPVNHPDVEQFINIKHNNMDKVKHANISIKLSDEFMKAVEEDKDFILCFNTHHETIEKTIKARDLWKKIIQSARDSAEPGLMFWDRMVEMSPSDSYPNLQIHATNPCGELPLEPGGNCVLSSMLLHKFVNNPYTESASFNMSLFQEMVRRGVRHLDNIVELNIRKHPLEEQVEASRMGRRIGLGITGLADMFAAMGIKYGSDESIDLANKIMNVKKLAEYEASSDLAAERGSFPLFDPNIHFKRGFCSELPEKLIEKIKKDGLRNVSLSTIAPNGSLSIIAQCSSGCEPIFAISYKRNVMLGKSKKKEFIIHHPGVIRYFNVVGPGKLPSYWVTAHDIDYKKRIVLQGVLQKQVDSSISSTINLSKDIDAQTVGDIYFTAWKEGLKGITVYREGSREGILITEDFTKEAGLPNMDTAVYCVRAEGGDKFYIMVSYKDKIITKPYQVFVMNYKRVDTDTFVKISNSLVKMLRENGVNEKRIQKYIDRSNNSLVKLTRFLSLSMKTGNLENAIQILDEHAFAGTLASRLYEILSDSVAARKALCPVCKSNNVKMEEGCVACLDCGWSRCT